MASFGFASVTFCRSARLYIASPVCPVEKNLVIIYNSSLPFGVLSRRLLSFLFVVSVSGPDVSFLFLSFPFGV